MEDSRKMFNISCDLVCGQDMEIYDIPEDISIGLYLEDIDICIIIG